MLQQEAVPVSEGIVVIFSGGLANKGTRNRAEIYGKRINITAAETRFLVAGGKIDPKIRDDASVEADLAEAMNRLYIQDSEATIAHGHGKGGHLGQLGPYNNGYVSLIRSRLRSKLKKLD